MSIFIAHIILVVSVGGMLLLVARKIPVLAMLPEVAVKKSPRTKKKFFAKIKNSATVLRQEFHKYKRLKKNDFFKDKVYKQEEFDRESDYWKKIRKEKIKKGKIKKEKIKKG